MARLKKHWRRWVLVGIALDCVALLFSHRLFAGGNVTITKAESIESLDGSPLDADRQANGIFTVGGNLTLTPGGKITCSRASNEPCSVRIAVGGNLVMLRDSEILSGGSEQAGGPIEIAVGGDFTLRGPKGGASGARIAASDRGAAGGAIDIYVIGKATTERGSSIASDAVEEGGWIAITAAATEIRGAVSAKASRPGRIAVASTAESPRS
ncbi:MAG TPA: hypothetical protein VKH43_04460 [Thermoanaerobaculia bacterium]|nr:hypothetical protein [Thermoanaerobaculia bacterium]